MNSTNNFENKPLGLIAKLACSLGNMFAGVATTDPRNCWNAFVYELEFPPEIAEELFTE